MALTWQAIDVSEDPFEARYEGDPVDVFVALAELLEARPDWHRLAACRGGDKTGVFFPGRGESTDPARAICADCPVKDTCLAAALEFTSTDDHGVWAGTSARQRRRLRRKPPRPAAASPAPARR